MEADQQQQTVEGNQFNIARDAHIGRIGDSVDTGGGDYVARDKVINYYVETETIVSAESLIELEQLQPAPGNPPYKGLAYYTEKDSALFFGRETLSDQLTARLQQTPFLTLLGASGSGKSSLLRAGIIPRLRQRNWRVHLITPGGNPLTALAVSLTLDATTPESIRDLRTMLANDNDTMTLTTARLAAKDDASRLLVAVDQFEEVFTQCRDDAERDAFVANLVHAVQSNGATSVLLSMRADFYDRLSAYPALVALVAREQAYITPMSQADLVRVIAEPAKQGGWRFIEGLVEQMVDDVGREPGRLPLLSHALLETWQRRRDVVLTLGGYREAGGVEGAIAFSAETTLSGFTDGQVEIARELFLNLTELGEGVEDTRRVTTRAELAARIDSAELTPILEAMAQARLIIIDKDTVEVAHEALIRRWPTLRQWLDENRESLRFERQLARDAQGWQNELNHDEGALYRGARLAQAQALVDVGSIRLVGTSKAFLTASREAAERTERERVAARQRELRQTRFLAVAALAVAALVIGILVFDSARSWYLQRQAQASLVDVAGQFSIEQHEVSNASYGMCVSADKCTAPTDPSLGYLDETRQMLPVVGVTAVQADTYCRWLGRQLPTSAEWIVAYESAELLPSEANVDTEAIRPMPVIPIPEDEVDPTSIYHLTGNVWEWTRTFANEEHGDWRGELSQLCVAQSDTTCVSLALNRAGGSWRSFEYSPDNTRPSLPFDIEDAVGFRCIKTN
jgi:energy-coupling factor transporter ATP-binding protein EcfA2